MIKRLLVILCPIMAVLMCVALIRAANGAGEISVNSILVDFQQLDFSLDPQRELIDFFLSGDFLDTFVRWDSNLTGIEGFFINIRNVVTSFFVTIGTVLATWFRGLWKIFVYSFNLFGSVFQLFRNILGYA